MNLQARAEAARSIALKVGEMLRHHGNLEIHAKADNDFVTEMDVRSESMIRDALLSQFPEDEFFGEESGGASRSDGRWIVDPIDGTQSFMRNQCGYCISIAYEHLGELVMGCVYIPVLDELYLAVRGQGATLNGKPIHVSSISEPRQAIAHFGYGHRVKKDKERTLSLLPGILDGISDLRRLGSAAAGLCYVASGRSDAFFELGLHIYDIAASIVMIEEAGGRVTGWSADEPYKETGNIIASNGLLHDTMLHLVSGEK